MAWKPIVTTEGLVDDVQVTLDQDDLLTAMVTHVKGAAAAAPETALKQDQPKKKKGKQTSTTSPWTCSTDLMQFGVQADEMLAAETQR